MELSMEVIKKNKILSTRYPTAYRSIEFTDKWLPRLGTYSVSTKSLLLIIAYCLQATGVGRYGIKNALTDRQTRGILCGDRFTSSSLFAG